MKIAENALESGAKLGEVENSEQGLEDSLLSGVKDGCENEAVTELEDSILDGPVDSKSSLCKEVGTSGCESDKTVNTKACENSTDSTDIANCSSKESELQIIDEPSDNLIKNDDALKCETDSETKPVVASSEECNIKSEQADEMKKEINVKNLKESIPIKADPVKKEDTLDEKIEEVKPDTAVSKREDEKDEKDKKEDSIDTIGASNHTDEGSHKTDTSADAPSTSGIKRPPSPSLPTNTTKKSKLLDDMIGRLSTAVGKAPEDLTDMEEDTTDKEESDSSSGSESSDDNKHPQLTKEVSRFLLRHNNIKSP